MLRTLVCCLLIGGCSTTKLPREVPFPVLPEKLMEAPVSLLSLPGTGPISAQDALETVVRNYGICEFNAGNQKALQDWLRGQAAIK